MRASTLVAAFAAVISSSAASAEPLQDLSWQSGREIYLEASRLDGSTITAVVQQDVPLPRGAGACVGCHRRSGFGVAEGGARSLNITGPALFQASNVAPIRPAYDSELLMRALVAGIGADGEPLSDLMPRYQVTRDDVLALASYLGTLGDTPPPGVSETELFIATIIAPDSTDDERAALEAIIPEFVEAKNGGTRQEQRRATASARHEYGIKSYRAYRKWRHSFWRLHGKPDTWPGQLKSLYAESTPFAILSGSLGSGAVIVHQFCEQYEIPCILPLTDVPPDDEVDFYSLYFSRGIRLEMDVVASQLTSESFSGRILLVYYDNSAGHAGVQELQTIFAPNSAISISTRAIRPNSRLSKADWTRLLKNSSADVVVALISGDQVQNLLAPDMDVDVAPEQVFTTYSYTDWSQLNSNQLNYDRIRHVYPYSMPAIGRSQFPLEETWLKSRKIALTNNVIAAQVVFSCKALGMALADIQGNFSRDYLLESLEHSLDNGFLSSLYPRTSLGPDQRFLSRGAYLARISDNDGRLLVTAGSWMQP